MSIRATLITSAAVLAFVSLAPRDATACGGTFCDSGPSAMPVDQSGENILFVMDGQNVEAHVQIQYQGSAARFAWIVPMPKVPDVSVGSAALFTNLLQGTVPRYGIKLQPDQCGGSGGSGGALGFGGASSGGAGGGGGISNDGGVTVVYDKTVGAFEVVVLQGGTAQEVSNWLATNNYQSINTAPAILQKYVQKSYVFVAIKLTGGASTDEIHPLVFKYAGNQPCVPLELTAVAATEDMGVRAFFLGDDRVVPTNYKHITFNPVRLDWTTLGSNYTQVISRAADSPVADGHAFVTEYAGPSSAVSPSGVYSTSWNPAAFQGIDPTNVVTELMNEGLLYCSPGYCQFYHPLILPLLHSYLPVPSGMTDADFYGCLSCNAAAIDQQAWNAANFAADFQSRIVDPGKHAEDVLLKYPYLTRLFTTISPAEMSLDPEFVANPKLSSETVSNNLSIATERITCKSQQGVLLPDGRAVGLDSTGLWPTFSSAMPWAETIEEFSSTGDRIVLVDNGAQIDSELAAWNKSVGWPPKGSAGNNGTGFGGGVGIAGTGGSGNGMDASGGGCACNLPGDGGSRASLFALGLGLLVTVVRRRRR